MGFPLVLKSVTLNGVMAIILHRRFSPKKCHKVHQLGTTDALCSSW